MIINQYSIKDDHEPIHKKIGKNLKVRSTYTRFSKLFQMQQDIPYDRRLSRKTRLPKQYFKFNRVPAKS